MPTRIAALLITGLPAATLLTLAQPALAQGQLPETEAETVFVEEGAVQPYGAAANRYQQVAQVQREIRPTQIATASPASSPLGYSEADREAWLADCTILLSERPSYVDDYYDNDADGGLIGGLIGLVVGGVAGNRIFDGDRLAGTLLGGGVGGIAGAVLGKVLDGDDDDDDIESLAFDPYAAEYCAAYLRRYEAQGAGAFASHDHSHHDGHVHTLAATQQAPARRRICRPCGEEVIEEVVVEEPRAARAIPRRAQPAPTKLIPVK